MQNISPKKAFTLVEVMISVTIFGLVCAAVFSTLLWSGRIAKECESKSWSQSKAMFSTSIITSIIRNADQIVSIDSGGDWAVLSFPGGSQGTLLFDEEKKSLLFQSDSGDSVTLAESCISQSQKVPGHTPPVFSRTGLLTNQAPNILQVQYRISRTDIIASQESDNAIDIEFSAYLTNYTP